MRHLPRCGTIPTGSRMTSTPSCADNTRLRAAGSSMDYDEDSSDDEAHSESGGVRDGHWLDAFKFDDEGAPTSTSEQQVACEDVCADLLAPLAGGVPPDDELLLEVHAAYLRRGLETLPSGWTSLDASRTWLAYWCLQGVSTLGVAHSDDPPALHARVIAFVRACAHPSGGYGGGPGHAPHTASSYSAVLALLCIGTPEAYAAIDRRGLLRFFRRMKQPAMPAAPATARGGQGQGGPPLPQPPTSALLGTSWAGGFTVQDSGECDVRGTYTALAIARLVNILTPDLGE